MGLKVILVKTKVMGPREGALSELLYADDLVLMNETN